MSRNSQILELADQFSFQNVWSLYHIHSHINLILTPTLYFKNHFNIIHKSKPKSLKRNSVRPSTLNTHASLGSSYVLHDASTSPFFL
jgi:hypothetical protein